MANEQQIHAMIAAALNEREATYQNDMREPNRNSERTFQTLRDEHARSLQIQRANFEGRVTDYGPEHPGC